MKRFTGRCLLATLIALALGTAAHAEDLRSARVSDVRGNLSVRGAEDDDFSYVERNGVIRHEDTLWTDDDGRTELELDRGSWVRLAEDTKLEVRALPPSAEFRIWNGSVYLDLSDRLEGRTLLKTPVGDVQVEPNSVVRVDLDKSESARVSVFNGRARAFPDTGSSVSLVSGERLYLEAGRVAPDPTRFDRGEQDGFDRYHRERVDYFISRPMPRELSSDIIGARELGDYGSWVSVENVTYWRPRCEPTWRPYSDGYWSYVPAFGYSWVDYSPWGYTTSHYGRWAYRPAYGWLWAPGYAWAPASVYWSSYGNYCGWAPLDPFGRPCYGSGSGFSFAFGTGNYFVDYRSWTFCDRDRFYYGRHHRNFGGRSFFAGHEINLRPDGFRPFRDGNRELGIPRDSIRGLTVSDRGIVARDRVRQLENRIPQDRQRLIADRYKVRTAANGELFGHNSGIDRLQRDPSTKIDPSRILKGDDADRRMRRDARPTPGPVNGDERQARDRTPGDRTPGDRTGRNPGDVRGIGPDGRPGATPGDRQADNRDRTERDSGFRRGEPRSGRDGDPKPGDPGRAGDPRRGDRSPDTGRPDTVKPGDRTPGDRTPADRPGDRDSIFRRGDGRRPDDKPGDPARPTNPARPEDSTRRDPAQPDNQRRDNERKQTEQREAARRDTERRETERRESERRDNDRRESERRDSERRNNERKESEKRDNDRKDSDRKPGSRGGATFQDFPARTSDASPAPARPGGDDRFRRGADDQSRPSYRDFRPNTGSTPSTPAPDRDSNYRRTAPSDNNPGRTAPSGTGSGYRSTPDAGYSAPSYSRNPGGGSYRDYTAPSRGGSYGSSPAPTSPSPSYGSGGRSYTSPAPSGGYSRGPGSYTPSAPSSGGGSGYRSGGDSYRGSSGSRGSSSGGRDSSSGGRGSSSGGGFRR